MKQPKQLTNDCPMNLGVVFIAVCIACAVSQLGAKLIQAYGGFWSSYIWDIIACIFILVGLLISRILRVNYYKRGARVSIIGTIAIIIFMAGFNL